MKKIKTTPRLLALLTAFVLLAAQGPWRVYADNNLPNQPETPKQTEEDEDGETNANTGEETEAGNEQNGEAPEPDETGDEQEEAPDGSLAKGMGSNAQPRLIQPMALDITTTNINQFYVDLSSIIDDTLNHPSETEAVLELKGLGATVQLPDPSLFPALPAITKDLTIIIKSTSPVTLFSHADPNTRHLEFDVADGKTLTLQLENITLSGGGDSGGIFVNTTGSNAYFVFANGVIENCYNTSNGGGIQGGNSNTALVHVQILEGTLRNNTAWNGGGVFASGGVTVGGDARITGNTANNYGGGVYGNSASPSNTTVTIEGNAEISGNTASGGGGGVYGGNGSVIIKGSARITGNTAGGSGGGVGGNGDVTVSENAAITGNTANGDGGGVYTGSGTIFTLNGNAQITGNTATGYGGGVYANSSVVVTGGSITGNTAGNDGGGLYLWDISKLNTLSGVSFGNNLATNGGYELASYAGYDPAWNNIPRTVPFSHVLNNYDIGFNGMSGAPPNTTRQFVVFDFNDGQGREHYREDITNTGNAVLGSFPTPPVRGGYAFVEWRENAGGTGNVIDETTNFADTQSYRVYAQWRVINTYTVTVTAASGGTATGGGDYSEGATANLYATPHQDYTFDGWYENGVKISGDENYSFAVTKNHAIEARFTPVDDGGNNGNNNSGGSTSRGSSSGIGSGAMGTHTIGFDTMGGSTASSILITEKGKVTPPVDPTRAGYIFTGWYTDKACTNPYDFDSEVTASFTLYAGWEPLDSEQGAVETVIPYISGYPDGTFGPDASISRAEAAQLLYNLMDKGLLPYTIGEPDANFSDVSSNAWYYGAVTALARTGAASGYPDGTFKPDATVTRAEFTAMVILLTGLEPEGSVSFPDISTNHWAAGYIAAAEIAGIIGGYPDGSFGPEDAVTRAQAVTILNNVLGRNTAAASFDGLAMPFGDVPLSHWAYYGIMAAAVEHSVAAAR